MCVVCVFFPFILDIKINTAGVCCCSTTKKTRPACPDSWTFVMPMWLTCKTYENPATGCLVSSLRSYDL